MAHNPYEAKNDLYHLMGLGGGDHPSSSHRGQNPDTILRATLAEGGPVSSGARGADWHQGYSDRGTAQPSSAGRGANWHQGYAEGGGVGCDPISQSPTNLDGSPNRGRYQGSGVRFGQRSRGASQSMLGSDPKTWSPYENHASGGEVDDYDDGLPHGGYGEEEQQPFHEAADEALPQDISDYEPQPQASKPKADWKAGAQKVKEMRQARQAHSQEEVQQPEHGWTQNDYRGGYKTGGRARGAYKTGGLLSLGTEYVGNLVRHPMKTLTDTVKAPVRILKGENAVHPSENAITKAKTDEYDAMMEYANAKKAAAEKHTGGQAMNLPHRQGGQAEEIRDIVRHPQRSALRAAKDQHAKRVAAREIQVVPHRQGGPAEDSVWAYNYR